jgi:hypothetical protein
MLILTSTNWSVEEFIAEMTKMHEAADRALVRAKAS